MKVVYVGSMSTSSCIFIFLGSKGGKVTKVTVAGCADKPVCPLKHKTNVSFEVDFKVGRYLIILPATIVTTIYT